MSKQLTTQIAHLRNLAGEAAPLDTLEDLADARVVILDVLSKHNELANKARDRSIVKMTEESLTVVSRIPMQSDLDIVNMIGELTETEPTLTDGGRVTFTGTEGAVAAARALVVAAIRLPELLWKHDLKHHWQAMDHNNKSWATLRRHHIQKTVDDMRREALARNIDDPSFVLFDRGE
jgi:hypothetical protein